MQLCQVKDLANLPVDSGLRAIICRFIEISGDKTPMLGLKGHLRIGVDGERIVAGSLSSTNAQSVASEGIDVHRPIARSVGFSLAWPLYLIGFVIVSCFLAGWAWVDVRKQRETRLTSSQCSIAASRATTGG